MHRLHLRVKFLFSKNFNKVLLLNFNPEDIKKMNLLQRKWCKRGKSYRLNGSMSLQNWIVLICVYLKESHRTCVQNIFSITRYSYEYIFLYIRKEIRYIFAHFKRSSEEKMDNWLTLNNSVLSQVDLRPKAFLIMTYYCLHNLNEFLISFCCFWTIRIRNSRNSPLHVGLYMQIYLRIDFFFFFLNKFSSNKRMVRKKK